MKRYNMNISCKGLYNRMSKGEINFDCAVQRHNVWDVERKSLLIHSILYGYSIPAFYMVKNDEGGFDSLDGKQRSNAIYEFMNGEFELTTNFPICYDDEEKKEDFSGARFENLPEWAQDRIKDYSLTIYYYEDMTEEEVREFFQRLNNGKPLTNTEKTRAMAKSIEGFRRLSTHPVVTSTASKAAKRSCKDEANIMRIYAMRHMANLDFGDKAFRPYIVNVDMTQEEEKEISTALDTLNNLLVVLREEDKSNTENGYVLRHLKAQNHFICAVYFAILCNERGISQDKYNEIMYDFFSVREAGRDKSYCNTCCAGSAKPTAVKKRKEVMESLLP